MKKLLIGIAVVIVVIIVAAFAIPFFIPADTYKAKVIALVKDATGRDLRIDGPVRFSLLPSLALEANDVALSNAPGAVAPNMVQLKTLDVKLALFPLLHGAIEIAEFKLVEPAINLEIDKQGRPNWVFATAAKPAPAAPATPATAPSSAGGSISSLSLGDVSIANGQASYLDQRSGEKRGVSDINMQLSLPSLAEPFSAKGAATWNGEKVNLTLAVAKPGALPSGGASPVALSVASTPINFDFQGEVSGASFSKLSGTTSLAVPSVRGLAKWAGVAFAPPGTGFGPLSIKGKVEMAGGKASFSDAAIALDSVKGTGNLAVDTGGARPAVSGRLDLDALDVNPYLPPENPPSTGTSSSGGSAPGSAEPAATSKSSGWSDAPLDLSGLKAADADFNLSANSILYRKIAIGKSALGLHLKDGRFEADLTEMALYQGKGQGKVVADGSGALPAIAASFNMSGVAIQPLLRDAAGFERLTGAGNFTLDVAGHGKSERDIVGALNGKGNLDLANGKIEGVNLVAFMKNVASSVTGGQGGSNDTNFGSLTGTYVITNGILKNDDLKLTSPEVPMTGAGTVDLPLRQVDYKLTPSVAGLVAVPVNITGPWDNLSYRPDVSGMAKDLAKDPGKALNAIEGGGSGAKSMLKGLLSK